MEVSAAAAAVVADTGAGAAVGGGVKSPEAETETPTQIQPRKGLSLTNGVLKRHQQHHHHHHHFAAPQVVVAYKECLKNHAASLGGHALDGCGEFMPSPTATSADPTSLKCAACGCHRNFHRREPDDPPPTTHVIEYQPHHRHQPPPPPPRPRSPNSPSPPPISSSYYPSAPHMLLALSAGISGPPENAPPISSSPASGANGRKRFRTKFSQGQKEKMFEFAERVGWKMQKRDEELVAEFCNEVGVDKGVLKVWMHNNKNTFGKRDVNGSRTSLDDNNENNENNENTENTENNETNETNETNDNNDNTPHTMETIHHTPNHNHTNPNPNNNDTTTAHLATNGSSSSS